MTSSRHGASVEMQLQQQQDLENRISGGMKPQKPLTAKKRHDPGKTVLGILMMIVGVVSFLHFVPHPFNLIVAPVALILGASVASARQCGHCGARVDRDAAECPRCALPFSTR